MINGEYNKGFTLVEMLVVMAVVGFLATVMVAHFSPVNLAVIREVRALADAIRQAQSSALGGLNFEDSPRCGYGVHIDAPSNAYWIYAGDSVSVGCGGLSYDPASNPIVRQTDLTSSGITLVSPNINEKGDDIFFTPPNPTTYINGVNDPGTDIVIYMGQFRREECPGNSCHAICPSSTCSVVTITTAGQVTIQSSGETSEPPRR